MELNNACLTIISKLSPSCSCCQMSCNSMSSASQHAPLGEKVTPAQPRPAAKQNLHLNETNLADFRYTEEGFDGIINYTLCSTYQD